MIPEHSTGKYAVGTEYFTFRDSTRKDISGKEQRKIAVRIYYPAPKESAAGHSRAVLLSERKIKAIKKMFMLRNLSNETVSAECFENLPHAENEKFPLILFSCGLGSYIESNSYLCTDIASHGYIVASVGHAYETSENDYDDGTYDMMDMSLLNSQYPNGKLRAACAQISFQTAKGTDEQLYKRFYNFQQKHQPDMEKVIFNWAHDMLCTLSKLKDLYAEWTDFSCGAAAAGHSLGGATAYYLCHHSDEITCGANMDGGLFGNYSGMKLEKPFLQICCKITYNAVTRALLDNKAPAFLAVFNKMTHIGFTDAKFFMNRLACGTLDSETSLKELVNLHLEFFGKYLKNSGTEITLKKNAAVTVTVH